MMPIDWREHIVSTADILRGKPRIKGTRISVSLILGYLAAGYTAEEIMAELPTSEKSRSRRVWIMPAHFQNLKWLCDGVTIFRRSLRVQCDLRTLRAAEHEVMRLREQLPVESLDAVVITKAQQLMPFYCR